MLRLERCKKYVNLVDLVKSFPTSIYLQKSESIQPRTSLSKFGWKFDSLFIRLLNDCPNSEARDRLLSGAAHDCMICDVSFVSERALRTTAVPRALSQTQYDGRSRTQNQQRWDRDDGVGAHALRAPGPDAQLITFRSRPWLKLEIP